MSVQPLAFQADGPQFESLPGLVTDETSRTEKNYQCVDHRYVTLNIDRFSHKLAKTRHFVSPSCDV